MVSALKRLENNTLEISVTLSWAEIKTEYNLIFEELLKEIELPGFRKGKAPRNLASKQIKSTKIYEEVLKKMVPSVYQKIISEQQIQPVISPKVEVLEAEAEKDWKLKILTCEKPQISLGNYQQAVAKLISQKKSKIWLPGQDKKDHQQNETTLSELFDVLNQEIRVEISGLMIEQEVNRRLSALVDQLQKLGMTVEQYLQSSNKTGETLRREYETEAKKTLGLEFALEEIADRENITVSDTEIDDFIAKAKTPEEKQMLTQQKYYLGSIIRRQKTVNKLLQPQVIKP